ncbi:dockerin type I repeat-containing protein [Geobacter sulfurreducens]|jgi:hypothetical protein|uniref:Uncharacterized protein n=1 Tax=Geobacter sulfurreducens (strain ATCC 51573 / DSM 12127 / PCA) TaxID=243231 RepID=I7EEW5_GEOSL|nr:dockerin type I repeat-containing protein [Geobacter sulfurreducens]ADI83662.1 hypothetical protein KN400_0799 [Geobacter sulfurreducens KN400]AFP20412.1 hypothetical protein GSU3509 [Geobacter sulfurreducens PCA]QVW36068.1 dockerin type I repeat-containing protein [Geobacter sulfurreducens]UAC04883.1 dockerin type I repeat-containing protein [Geobacter sulfurreducens]UTG93509.1 dockerin type I repeat-containing protein [Geobacter sulfurreducens]
MEQYTRYSVGIVGATLVVFLAAAALMPGRATALEEDPSGMYRCMTLSRDSDGDLNGDGAVTIQDALAALRIAVGQATPTDEQATRGDVYPRINGAPCPDGKIDLRDVMAIVKKANGVQN